MQKLAHIFLMFCFVLASVSPACAFVSGKHVMEICGADGSVRTMPIPEELLAFLPDQPASADLGDNIGGEFSGDFDQSAQALDDCAFCFAQTHLKSFVTHTASVPVFALERQAEFAHSAGAHHRSFSAYLSRAPPTFLS